MRLAASLTGFFECSYSYTRRSNNRFPDQPSVSVTRLRSCLGDVLFQFPSKDDHPDEEGNEV